MTDHAIPIPAATLMLLRDAPGAPEVLMVERSMAMAFAGGALVFPGGRLDAGDVALAHTLMKAWDGDSDEAAARIAAIRETIEEAGVGVGLSPPPSADTLNDVREALQAGEPLDQALDAAGLTLGLDALTPFARWLPDHAPVRIFDTRFYLARLPADAPAASVDATENVALSWSTAADFLAQADAGHVTIIYPTRRNLERLAQFGTVDEALTHARNMPVRTITPFIEQRGDCSFLCIPDGLGYPVTAEPITSVKRG